MKSTKFVIIFQIIIPLFTFSMPISDDSRKALKQILKTMDKKIMDGIRWRQTNCREITGFPDESEIVQKVQNLLKKLKISGEEKEIKKEIGELFEAVESILEKMIEKMEQMLQTLVAYSPKWRFDEALKEEMNSPQKCTLNFGQGTEIGCIHSYVDQNRLESIRFKLRKLFILQTMAMPKKQKAFGQYFETYYYKKQDLERELSRTNNAVYEAESAKCATTELWEKTTYNFCCDEIWPNDGYECSECWLFCLPCWCTGVVLGPIVTVPKDLCRCVRKSIGKCKSAQIKAELAKIEAKKAQIPQLDTSSTDE